MTHTKDEALKLALEALEGNTTNPVIDPDQAAIEDQAINAIKQALAAPVQPVAWAEYHYKKGRFTGLTTNDINAVDSVGDGCQWVPQLQALAQPAVPLTDEQAKQLLKDSDLLEMFENIGWYSSPRKAFNGNGLKLIRAAEAAHGITEKGQP